jgi:hypothetical protein
VPEVQLQAGLQRLVMAFRIGRNWYEHETRRRPDPRAVQRECPLCGYAFTVLATSAQVYCTDGCARIGGRLRREETEC